MSEPLGDPDSPRLELPAGFATKVLVLDRLDEALLPTGRWTLIGDENVREHWLRHRLPEPPGSLWVPTSEQLKRLDTVIPWLERWAELPLHRNATILAVGGGVLTDMAGLAASLYLRGVTWHAWPTTLLSQLDAGMGGKTAVNLSSGKNLAGAFHPPQRMVVCAEFLSTLPLRHLEAGAWELFKMALMEGDTAWAETLLDQATPRRSDVVRSITLKAGIVHRDLTEQGERKLLNLGHTLGHALEAASRFALFHGEAVGLGTLAACLLAQQQGLPSFSPALLGRFADRLRPLAGRVPSWEACLPILSRDKKAVAGAGAPGESAIHCVLPVPGQRAVLRWLPPEAWGPAHAGLLDLLS